MSVVAAFWAPPILCTVSYRQDDCSQRLLWLRQNGGPELVFQHPRSSIQFCISRTMSTDSEAVDALHFEDESRKVRARVRA